MYGESPDAEPEIHFLPQTSGTDGGQYERCPFSGCRVRGSAASQGQQETPRLIQSDRG
jgi:hypothetical protein